jgi:hypothetical protein
MAIGAEADRVGHYNDSLRETLSRRLFAKRIMQNQIRPLYVEAMIEQVLEPDWVYVGADWGGWDFEGPSGIRLEVKQSAALQSWSAGRGITTRAVFDIAPRTGFYGKDGVEWTKAPGRQAQVYVFALALANRQNSRPTRSRAMAIFRGAYDGASGIQDDELEGS